MNAVERFLMDYLLNALWQAPAVCAAAWVLSRMLRRLGPAAEHRVWVGALVAQCVLPACSAPNAAAWLRHLFASGIAADGGVSVTAAAAVPLGTTAWPAPLVHGLVLVYVMATAVFAARLARQCGRLRRLRAAATPLVLSPEAAGFVQDCCAQLGLRRIEFAAAAAVHTPLTFGTRRPVVLLPQDFCEQVTSPQMKTALSHELAHVVRHDAAKQLLYRVISLPIAFHPALAFTLAQIAETRERVCDRTAVAQTGDARGYAHALLDLASMLTARRPAHSNAIGLFDANQFERRVLMLNRREIRVSRSLRVALVTSSMVVAGAVGMSAIALHVKAPLQSMAAGAMAGPVRVSAGVMAAQTVSKVVPVYPPDAKEAKLSGTVVLDAVIGSNGTVQQLRVLSGPDAFHTSALDAVRQWVYKPFLLNGQPVDVETTITVTYSLAQ